MSCEVAISHNSRYEYGRPIIVDPQVIRLRPAQHCRTPIYNYSLAIQPADHFLRRQSDLLGNPLARVVFPNRISELQVSVRFVADLSSINPFDFFLENHAVEFPFQYERNLELELQPYLQFEKPCSNLTEYRRSIDITKRGTVSFLADLNERIHEEFEYETRLDPGVQSCGQTLAKKKGACRDTSWLLIQLLRQLGLAARFVSGYLVQLKSDAPHSSISAEGCVERDSAAFHAWVELYLPGAGWIGLDPTSGLFASEGHIPVAGSPSPSGAAPIYGRHEVCDPVFNTTLTVRRVHKLTSDTNHSHSASQETLTVRDLREGCFQKTTSDLDEH